MFDMKIFITAKTAYYSVHYITRELYLISEHGQTSGLETHFCQFYVRNFYLFCNAHLWFFPFPRCYRLNKSASKLIVLEERRDGARQRYNNAQHKNELKDTTYMIYYIDVYWYYFISNISNIILRKLSLTRYIFHIFKIGL